MLNPYRYRGYRYDIETGLYYLQSRYYNPEWGRFINADAILGQTGELLSHNMFAYCANNPVMMKDPSGYLHTFAMADGGGRSKTPYKENKLASTASSIAGSGLATALGTGVEAAIAAKVTSSWTSKIFYPQTFSKALSAGYGNNYVAVKALKFAGLIGVASLGISVWDNLANYKHGALRTAIDVGAFIGSALIGAALGAVLAPTIGATALAIGIGVAIGYGAGYIKEKYLSEKKVN